MAFCELRYFSPALMVHTAAAVVIPQREQDDPWPVLYLLHGLGDDYTIWSRRTNIERYVESYPMVVVMPDGGRGFYSDAVAGPAYERAIIGDLIPLIDRTFAFRRDRGGRAIGGLSMGGYGAFKLALRYPSLFGSAHSHSGAFHFGHYSPQEVAEAAPERIAEFGRILGDASTGGPQDLFRLVQERVRGPLPALRMDCGTEDYLLADNRDFHQHLLQQQIAHEYSEFPGAHEWSYWDFHVQSALAFHLRRFA